MTFPIDRLRAETPGVDHVVHLNNAGSALPPSVVVDTVIGHLRREAEIGGYEAAAESAARTEAVYDSIARLIGARPTEIATVENATVAWDMAVYGYPFRTGDRVLTGRAEYAANVIALLQLQQRHGIEIVLVEDDDDGQISLDHLARELEIGAAMVTLTHLPTNDGLVNPAAEVGALCRRHDVLFVLDACQAVGHVPIDVEAIGCDVLSATGRKYLRGPRGTGFLYVGPRAFERLEPPFLDLHAAAWTGPRSYELRDDARRFENWETNHAARCGRRPPARPRRGDVMGADPDVGRGAPLAVDRAGRGDGPRPGTDPQRHRHVLGRRPRCGRRALDPRGAADQHLRRSRRGRSLEP